MTDPMIGRAAEIISVNGVRYQGIVIAIRDRGEAGELFELGSHESPAYRRLVFVTDRRAQVHSLPAN